jgi:hypothetical protein
MITDRCRRLDLPQTIAFWAAVFDQPPAAVRAVLRQRAQVHAERQSSLATLTCWDFPLIWLEELCARLEASGCLPAVRARRAQVECLLVLGDAVRRAQGLRRPLDIGDHLHRRLGRAQASQPLFEVLHAQDQLIQERRPDLGGGAPSKEPGDKLA